MTRLAILASLLFAAACTSGGEPASIATTTEALAGPVDIGFGGAGLSPDDDPYEFAAEARFFAASQPAESPRLCHVYLPWDLATRPVGDGSAHDPKSRAWFEDLIAGTSPEEKTKLTNPCEEMLVSFQSAGAIVSPVPANYEVYGSAFKRFLDQFGPRWRASGPKRRWSFTAWNEPNGTAGMTAELAAELYLEAHRLCLDDTSKCTVAAGDMGSFPDPAEDFIQRCPEDEASTLCAHPSWIDRYKHAIAIDAPKFSLGKDFRPAVWSYHPWLDMNRFVYDGLKCTEESTCVTLGLARSLGGSWSKTEIWNTEVGSGMNDKNRPNDGDLDDRTQARGAAYLLELTRTEPRIKRIYYQGVDTGAWQILCGQTPRPAFTVLATRKTAYTGGETDVCARAAPSGSGSSSSASSSTGTSSSSSSGVTCAPGLELCGTDCVDTSTDEGHCGGCDTRCSGTELCQGSTCYEPNKNGCAIRYCDGSDDTTTGSDEDHCRCDEVPQDYAQRAQYDGFYFYDRGAEACPTGDGSGCAIRCNDGALVHTHATKAGACRADFGVCAGKGGVLRTAWDGIDIYVADATCQ